MKLLNFQRNAVDAVVSFFDEYSCISVESKSNKNNKKPIDKASLAWIMSGNAANKQYCPILSENHESIPNVALCIPTGGGKTIVGITSAIEILEKFPHDSSKFIVWMVPSEAIYNQVLLDFSVGGKYYEYVNNEYSRKINIKKISDTWIDSDLTPDSTTVLVLTFQSIIRKNSSKSLQVYRNADKVATLSAFINTNREPSLYSLLCEVKPIFIIDESHRYYTEIGRDFFKQETISDYVIELSATHKYYSSVDYPNIVYSANGKTLIDEQLIKKPIVYHSLSFSSLEDLIKGVIKHHSELEKLAMKSGSNIVPKVLISSEFTGIDHADEEYSAHNIKNILLKFGVSVDSIALKSSEVDEIKGHDLDNPNEKIRFVITKRALMEGWDCKSIYIIMMVNKIGADVTNFQLIGRGLRQPHKKYSSIPELNELHVYTNSTSHDSAVSRLTAFLSDSGLSDSISDLVISADNRTSQSFNLQQNFPINIIDPVDDIFLNKNFIALKFFKGIDYNVEKFIVDEAMIMEPEERLQKIDLSKSNIFGVMQGRPTISNISSLEDYSFDFSFHLQEYLYKNLRIFLPTSSLAYKLASTQVSVLTDRRRAYYARLDILNKIKSNFSEAISSFFELYFEAEIVNNLKTSNSNLIDIFGDVFSVNCMPDIVLNEPFVNCVQGNIPKSLFNDQELSFARYLDRLPDSMWLRNPPLSGIGFPYAFGNFYPDFVLFNKNNLNSIFIETKGDHLVGNLDSSSKVSACKLINNKFSPNVMISFGSFDQVIGDVKLFTGKS